MRYPHNQLDMPVRPRLRWETKFAIGHAPADATWAYHQQHFWIDGQDPKTVEFVDVQWGRSECAVKDEAR